MDNELLRLQTGLRVARFRLEGLSPDRAEWKVASIELAALEREVARSLSPSRGLLPSSRRTGS